MVQRILRPWSQPVLLDRNLPMPVGQQIVHAMIQEIRRGRLGPGTSLPGGRELAEKLSVNRKTVVQAYSELEAQGWVTTQSRRGTFVAENLPRFVEDEDEARPTALAEPRFVAAKPPPELMVDLPARDMLAFDDGAPDMRLVPIEILARAYRNGLRSAMQRRRLAYDDPRGSATLRSALSRMLNAERGLAIGAEHICVTRGSQMAIFVVAQTLVLPGDTVVVETLTYPPAREAFRRAGADVAAVAVDASGICVDELERLCISRRVKAVYVTPHHHFPTTVSMTAERRLRLLLLSSRFGFSIIEDDYDHEFHFGHQPMLPLAAFDRSGSVIYIGSLSKLLSPSVRLGYVSAPPNLVERFSREIVMIDRQGDSAMEMAVAEFMEAGELRRHTRKMMRVYAERRQHFAECLEQKLADVATFTIPDGGLAFWVNIDGIDISYLLQESRKKLLHFQSPAPFSTIGDCVGALRLGFASLDLDELSAATDRLAQAIDVSRRI